MKDLPKIPWSRHQPPACAHVHADVPIFPIWFPFQLQSDLCDRQTKVYCRNFESYTIMKNQKINKNYKKFKNLIYEIKMNFNHFLILNNIINV